jgi:hypothetical protein
MKKLFTLLFVGAFALSFSQKSYKISTSSEIELKNKTSADNIVSYGTEDVCLVSSKYFGPNASISPKVEDTKYSFFNGVVFKKTVDLIPKEEDAKYIETYINNGKLCYIDASYNKSKSEIETYYREVDDNGNIIKSVLMNNILGSISWLYAPESIFKTFQSPNNKKIANIAIYKKKEKTTEYNLCYDGIIPSSANSMKIGVIDENGKLFFKKEISISAPSNCDIISIEDYKINDAGDVFLMVKQYLKGKKEKGSNGSVNYKLYIYAITNNGISSKKYAIDTKEYFCKRPSLVVANTGNIFCAGFISEKVSGKFEGIFTQKLGADLDTTQFKINKITTEDILKYNSKFKYKDDEISNNFEIRQIAEVGNAIHIVSEFYDTKTTSNTTQGITQMGSTIYSRTSYSTMYYYYDILYFELDNKLNIKQIYSIPKYQRSGTPLFLGYKLIFHDNKPYFIFNDSKKNIGKEEDEMLKVTGSLKDYAAMIVYHNGNSWVRERMFEKEEVDDNILMTRAVRQFDDNNIFLPFQKKGNYVLGKLTFTK